jgi:ATP adenylyltransferase
VDQTPPNEEGGRLQRLWAPWRESYVTAPKTRAAMLECFICSGLAGTEDRENLLVWRGSLATVFLNRFPYNNGHLLVAPRAHKAALADLTTAENVEIMETLTRMVSLLDDLMHPDGYNIGLNLGQVAGAGLPGHLHWHLVPRWNGDTNFMPVLADSKVIVQSLDALYGLLTERLLGPVA